MSVALSIVWKSSLYATSERELNSVAFKVPVDGLKNSFVEETLRLVTVPVVELVNDT